MQPTQPSPVGEYFRDGASQAILLEPRRMAGSRIDDADHNAEAEAHGSSSSNGASGPAVHASPAKVVCQPSLRCQEAQAMPTWSPFPSWFRMMFVSGGPTNICCGDVAGMGDIVCDVVRRRGTVRVGTNLLGGVP